MVREVTGSCHLSLEWVQGDGEDGAAQAFLGALRGGVRAMPLGVWGAAGVGGGLWKAHVS